MSCYLKSKSLLEQWYATGKGSQSLELICRYLGLFFKNSNIDNYLQIGSMSNNKLGKIIGAENSVLIENYKIPLTEHIIGEFELLPILEDHFDIVILPHTLEVSEPNSVLFESYRVLKPGGIIVVIGFDVNLFNTVFGGFDNSIYKKYSSIAKLININTLNKQLASSGFALINNKIFCVKQGIFIKHILYLEVIQKIFNMIAGDLYVSISRKKIVNLDSIKNKNRLFSKKTISLPGDTAWD